VRATASAAVSERLADGLNGSHRLLRDEDFLFCISSVRGVLVWSFGLFILLYSNWEDTPGIGSSICRRHVIYYNFNWARSSQ
jgi:hypothetical protein